MTCRTMKIRFSLLTFHYTSSGIGAFFISSRMALAFFYTEKLETGTIVLDENNSRHIVQVLRMAKGAMLLLTDGKGKKAEAEIVDDNKKHCGVQIASLQQMPDKKHRVTIGLSLIKNSSRFEWFLEKATEIGISEIIPLICERTEKEKFRHDRLNGIVISAMLQSQQCWLPLLHEPVEFQNLVQNNHFRQRFIAHCLPEQKQVLPHYSPVTDTSSCILIGPEGDFTKVEIELAIKHHFHPVALGPTRLRTETAGVV